MFGISWQALNTIMNDYGITYTKINNHCYLTEIEVDRIRDACLKVKDRSVSSREYTLHEFIETLSVETIFNDRKTLNGKEIDVYFPNNKVGIEFNGLYWHSCTNGKKEKSYHLEKTKLCENNGIRLIHIFEDEWVNHKEICKSIICSALGLYKDVFYARNTEFREIIFEEYEPFMHKNNINGIGIKPTKMFGLFFNNELVQCAGFFDDGNKVELLGVVSKLNTKIIGGISKLIKKSKMHNFILHVDRRMFNGYGYLKCGFKRIGYGDPSFFYVNGLNRFDNLIDKNLDRQEKIIKNKFDLIYDCGTIEMFYV